MEQKPFRHFRHIRAYSGIIKYIRTYSDIIRNYSGIFRHTQNPVQPWYIKNPHIFRTIGIFRTLSKIYDEAPCEIVNSYIYLPKLQLLSRYQLFTFWTSWNEYHGFFNTDLSFTPEIFILMQKSMGPRGQGAGGRKFWYTLKFQ